MSPASWSAPPWLASGRFHVPTWVKMVLGPFAETKGPRLPAPKPGPSKCEGQTPTDGGEEMLGGENSIKPNPEVGVFIDFKGCLIGH